MKRFCLKSSTVPFNLKLVYWWHEILVSINLGLGDVSFYNIYRLMTAHRWLPHYIRLKSSKLNFKYYLYTYVEMIRFLIFYSHMHKIVEDVNSRKAQHSSHDKVNA